MLFRIICIILLVLCLSGTGTGQTEPEGYRLSRDASYFITAPRKVHPNQLYQLSVSILQLFYDYINVRATVRMGKEEIAQAYKTFYTTGTQFMQMHIPENQNQRGNYTLRIEGTTLNGMGGAIFENETKLIYDSKQVSLFIQINKPLYRQGQLVKFRIMPVEKNLMSRSGSMDVYIEDSTETVVRRWLSMQTNAGGVLNMEFQLSEQPHYGTWKVKCYAFGHWYEEPFTVNEYYFIFMDVNVSIPIQLNQDDYGVAGVVSANWTLGQPARGTQKLLLEVWRPLGDRVEDEEPLAVLEQPSRFFPGVTDFVFSFDDILEALGSDNRNDIANKELLVTCEVYDWFLMQTSKGKAWTVVYDNIVRLRLLGDSARTFKPNQTLDVYYAAVNSDGTAIDRNRRQVTILRIEEGTTGSKTFEDKYSVGDNGIVKYRFTPHMYATFIRINAYYDDRSTDLIEMTMHKTFSPTESYIYLTTSTSAPQVDQYIVFTVSTTTYVDEIIYVLTSGGDIITGGLLTMRSRQKTFALSVSRDMIPEAHLVVWYIHYGEVIADAINFFVNGTRINDIEVRVSRGKDFTGDIVELNSFADPSSFIGFNGISYELWAYGWNPFITESKMVEELDTYEAHVNSSFGWKWKLPEEQDQYIHFTAPTYGVDANQTFDYAGLLVFSDANVTRVAHNCNDTLGYHPCMDGNCYDADQRCDGVRQCEDGQDEMGCDVQLQVTDKFTPAKQRLGLISRHYIMDGHWLWGSHFVMPYGRLDVLTNVPDEPMSWVISAFGISKDLGFGIKHNPARHQANRPFYMRAQAPTNAIKGEQIGIRLALFNYHIEDIEAIIMLHHSDQYRFVIVEEFGIVSSYDPRTISGDIQTMLYLEKGHTYEIHMPVLPIVDGCIKVVISAHTFLYEDREELTICTEYDGVTNFLHTPYFIDLINSGSLVLPDLEIPVPERFVKPEERQHLYVPGSPVATVGIVGDVVGPGFFEEYLTAENTLRKPFGSGEQNAYNFAYNLYNLIYLKATNQLKSQVLDTSLHYLNIAFQRQLSYYNGDGSFSQFRDYQTYTPSTWLTAFVMQVLNDAQEKDWELDIFIPDELLNTVMLWLCKQQTSLGAFNEEAPIYDRKMRSNYTTINGQRRLSNYSITAFVAITMAKSTRVTGSAEQCRTSTLALAKSYLETHFMKKPANETDVFETCICTYALHLAGSQKSTEAFNKMQALRRTDNLVYWANKKIPANDIRTVDNIPYYQPRKWYDNEGYGVHATAYALHVYQRRNLIVDSEPIMQWLQTMRNTYAGQASTQDTIAALQALVEYAKKDTNRAIYNVQVTVEATSIGNWSQNVNLESSNWPDQSHVNIHPVWGSVRGRAMGTGRALMQLATRVNVEYKHQILPAAQARFFDVEILAPNYTGKNFSIMEITPCAKWARPDISNHSGMAVLEIHVPTGYTVTNDLLRAYAQSGDVPTLRRAEAYDRKVVFYFDYLEFEQKTCVHFRLDRWYPVANMTIQHLLKVYDYYEPGMHNTTLYTTYTLFNLHLCQVCGSFQCPYCKFYNSAPPLTQPRLSTLLATAFAYLIANLLTKTGVLNSIT